MTTRRTVLKGIAGMLATGISMSVLPSGVIMPIREILTVDAPEYAFCYTWFKGKKYIFSEPFQLIDEQYALISSPLTFSDWLVLKTSVLHDPRVGDCIKVGSSPLYKPNPTPFDIFWEHPGPCRLFRV